MKKRILVALLVSCVSSAPAALPVVDSVAVAKDESTSPAPSVSAGGIQIFSARVLLAPGTTTTVGFVVVGTDAQTFLIRAVGPKLADFGVANVTMNTSLTVYSGGQQVAQNSGWRTVGPEPQRNTTQWSLWQFYGYMQVGALTGATYAAGAFSLSSYSNGDSEVCVSLKPGIYTADIVGSGWCLIEVYNLGGWAYYGPSFPSLYVSHKTAAGQ